MQCDGVFLAIDGVASVAQRGASVAAHDRIVNRASIEQAGSEYRRGKPKCEQRGERDDQRAISRAKAVQQGGQVPIFPLRRGLLCRNRSEKFGHGYGKFSA